MEMVSRLPSGRASIPAPVSHRDRSMGGTRSRSPACHLQPVSDRPSVMQFGMPAQAAVQAHARRRGPRGCHQDLRPSREVPRPSPGGPASGPRGCHRWQADGLPGLPAPRRPMAWSHGCCDGAEKGLVADAVPRGDGAYGAAGEQFLVDRRSVDRCEHHAAGRATSGGLLGAGPRSASTSACCSGGRCCQVLGADHPGDRRSHRLRFTPHRGHGADRQIQAACASASTETPMGYRSLPTRRAFDSEGCGP